MMKQSSTFIVDKVRIPYARYTHVFSEREQIYFYVIDLTKEETRKKVEESGILTEKVFFDFQMSVLSPIFFRLKEPLQYNLNLIFVLPDDMDVTSEMWHIKEDTQYMRKLFLSTQSLQKLLFDAQKREIYSISTIGKERYKIRNFNVLSDPEPRNNLELLKALSESLKSPIFNLIHYNVDDYLSLIQHCNPEVLEYYYQKLWSMFEEQGIPESPLFLSSTEQEMLYLASILATQKKDQALLLDGLAWRRLDGMRKLNLLTTLSDFSERSGSVLVTCENKNDIALIKKKIYRPNFLTKHETK